jgi:hypothetical protein
LEISFSNLCHWDFGNKQEVLGYSHNASCIHPTSVCWVSALGRHHLTLGKRRDEYHCPHRPEALLWEASNEQDDVAKCVVSHIEVGAMG